MDTDHIVPLTAQQVFNNALFGVRGQNYKPSSCQKQLTLTNGRSVDPETCLYRGPGGLKCGIGHSIPDDMYTDTFEGRGIGGLIVPFFETEDTATQNPLRALFRGVSLGLLAALQAAHDDLQDVVDMGDEPTEFEQAMALVANRFNLHYSGVDSMVPA